MDGKGQAGRVRNEECEAAYDDVSTFGFGIRPKRALRITVPPAQVLCGPSGPFLLGTLRTNMVTAAEISMENKYAILTYGELS
jgi:hypothetical protein